MNSETRGGRVRGAIRSAASSALIVAFLAACQPIYANRGYLADPQAVAQVTPGKSTKADVTRLMGSPSTISTFDPNVWYYINRQTDQVAFFDPTLLNQRVYVVQFDQHGTVKDLQTRDNDTHEVEMIDRTTPAPGRELTFFEQLIGNFGATNKSKKTDKKDDHS